MAIEERAPTAEPAGPQRVRLLAAAAAPQQRAGARARGRRPHPPSSTCSSSWGCSADDPRPGRDRRRRGRSRSPARRSPSPATSPQPAAACRSTRSSSATCADARSSSELGGVRRPQRAPRHRRRPSSRSPAPPGRPRSRRRARGRRLGRRDGGRHHRAATRCSPTSPPGPGVAMAANVVVVRQPVAVRGHPPGRRRRRARGDAAGERPAVFTVAGHAVEPRPPPRRCRRPGRRARPRSSPTRTCSPGSSRPSRARPDLSGSLKSARVVVGAGRGAGGPEGFDDLLELAELLGGSLGVSRVVTSLGWRPHHEQVGQTGSRISPELYIPCGISGAIQHWAGLLVGQDHPRHQHRPRGADGHEGDYAVIGDLHEVVPAINAEIRRRRG